MTLRTTGEPAAEAAAAAPEHGDTAALIDHILRRYHETHRRELTQLIELARKVQAVHTDHPRLPHGLAELLQEIRTELEAHMRKEEMILFPAMLQCAGGGLGAPIARMRHDHAEHGEHLQRLEHITGGFAVPDGACRSWQALYSGAAKLAADLIEHITLENTVLFPRFEAGS